MKRYALEALAEEKAYDDTLISCVCRKRFMFAVVKITGWRSGNVLVATIECCIFVTQWSLECKQKIENFLCSRLNYYCLYKLKTMIKTTFQRLRQRLSHLSFRTGAIVLGACVCCYALSFTLPFLVEDNWMKGAVWACFFGLAKTFQYTGLAIVGVEGWRRIKAWFQHRKWRTSWRYARGVVSKCCVQSTKRSLRWGGDKWPNDLLQNDRASDDENAAIWPQIRKAQRGY